MTVLVFAPVVAAAAIWLFRIAIARPRFITYLIFALAPTQFLFVPVSSFFISPADVLVLAGGFAFAARAVAGAPKASASLWAHRYLILMLTAYLLGFALLGVFSRTLVRVAMAIVPSLLACEVLRERRHLLRAAAALIIAGVIDAGYGLVFYASGHPLFPGRFSGMSSTNFSATVIVTSAAIGLAQLGRARRWVTLVKPGALLTVGLATLSQAGVLAFIAAWLAVLRRVIRRRNILRIAAAGLAGLIIALSFADVRQLILSRNARTVENDGVARNSADVRIMVLRSAWAGFSDSPVLGIGYSQFPKYSTRDPEIDASTAGQGYGTHDMYVEILVEGGLVAFFCFVFHFSHYSGLGRVLRIVALQKDGALASTVVGLPIVLVAAAFANMMLHYHFWAVCGLALASVHSSRQSARTPALLNVHLSTVTVAR